MNSFQKNKIKMMDFKILKNKSNKILKLTQMKYDLINCIKIFKTKKTLSNKNLKNINYCLERIKNKIA